MRNRELALVVLAVLVGALVLPGCTTTKTRYSERGRDGSDIQYSSTTRVPIGGKIADTAGGAKIKIDAEGGSLLELSSQATGLEGGDAQAITAAIIQAVSAGAQLGAIAMGAPGGVVGRAASGGAAPLTDDQLRATIGGVQRDVRALQGTMAEVQSTLAELKAAGGIYSAAEGAEDEE